MRFAFIAKAPGDLADIVDMRGARGLAQWLSRLAGACAERAFAQRRGVRRQGPRELLLLAQDRKDRAKNI